MRKEIEQLVLEHQRELMALQLAEQKAKTERAESRLRQQRMIEQLTSEQIAKRQLPKLPWVNHGGIVVTVDGAQLVKRVHLAADLVDQLARALPACCEWLPRETGKAQLQCGKPATKKDEEDPGTGGFEGSTEYYCDEHGGRHDDCAWAPALRRAKEHGFL